METIEGQDNILWRICEQPSLAQSQAHDYLSHGTAVKPTLLPLCSVPDVWTHDRQCMCIGGT